jgi:hypothetical protein
MSGACRTPVTDGWHPLPAMPPNALAIIALRREIADRYTATTRQWIAARTTYRRLHEAPVKNLSALRDAARRLDQLEQGRAALLRDLKALAD